MTNQVKMIIDCIKAVESIDGISTERAFKLVLHWCAHQVRVPGVVIKATLKSHSYLSNNFDLELLKSQRWDWFGEACLALGLGGPSKTQNFMPSDISRSLVNIQMASFRESLTEPLQTLIDPCCGSGRMLLSAYDVAGDGLLYYGMEADKLMYRMCLINVYMYNLPAKVICDSALTAEKQPSSSNWQYANMWHPQSKLHEPVK